MSNRILPVALLGALAAAPLAAQTFTSPLCPDASIRIGNACRAANGIVVKRFDIPQIQDDMQVYDLTSDSPYAENGLGQGERVVIRDGSVFVTDLDARLTVISD